ncbi:hypothetical protein OAO01_00700 [Oligoflexia bacterium]|nr:hypothetical protein [Oligoflexia bacterium]
MFESGVWCVFGFLVVGWLITVGGALYQMLSRGHLMNDKRLTGYILLLLCVGSIVWTRLVLFELVGS